MNFLKHLFNEIKRHLFSYLLLLTTAVFFLILLNLYRGNRSIQFVIVTLFVLFYILWGIVHHAVEKTLHLKIVIEYILIGAVALFLLEIWLIY